MYCCLMTYGKKKEHTYPSSKAENELICIGLMMVKRFEDGSEIFSITGYYKDHRDSALDSAVELTAYVKNRWRGLED